MLDLAGAPGFKVQSNFSTKDSNPELCFEFRAALVLRRRGQVCCALAIVLIASIYETTPHSRASELGFKVPSTSSRNTSVIRFRHEEVEYEDETGDRTRAGFLADALPCLPRLLACSSDSTPSNGQVRMDAAFGVATYSCTRHR